MSERKPASLAETLRQEVLEGTRSEWYAGQRAQYQREEEQRQEQEAQRQAAIQREADRQIEQLKREGKWV